MPGAGASSITFWLRRCKVQSRSKRCTALPCASPKTCTSMWRGATTSLLHQHTRVTEGALRLALRALERGGKILRALDQTHATPAATSHCLDHQRIADAVCLAKQGFQILSVAVIAGHHRHTRGPCDGFGSRLAAELAHRLAGWADELDAGLGAGVGKVGILGQEAIARVNGIRARVASPPTRCGRCASSSRSLATGRCAPRRRRPPRAAPARRHRNRPQPWQCPSAVPCG